MGVSNIKSLTSISSSEISRNDDFCSYKFEGGEIKESLSFQHLRRKLNNFITKSFPVKMAWLTNNSSGNGFGQSSNSHGGFSNNWCMQGDSKAEVTNNIHFLKEVPRHQILETVDCHFHNQRDKRLKRKRKKTSTKLSKNLDCKRKQKHFWKRKK